ncbi:MAG TPA: hypothetical protein VEL76_14775, partial [Gemmataceae bacterium]|nr:hypothetical protein [Gemmataceae bacterium]
MSRSKLLLGSLAVALSLGAVTVGTTLLLLREAPPAAPAAVPPLRGLDERFDVVDLPHSGL